MGVGHEAQSHGGNTTGPLIENRTQHAQRIHSHCRLKTERTLRVISHIGIGRLNIRLRFTIQPKISFVLPAVDYQRPLAGHVPSINPQGLSAGTKWRGQSASHSARVPYRTWPRLGRKTGGNCTGRRKVTTPTNSGPLPAGTLSSRPDFFTSPGHRLGRTKFLQSPSGVWIRRIFLPVGINGSSIRLHQPMRSSGRL